MNVYGHSFDDPLFFENVFEIIPDFMHSQLIMAGDYNCVLNAMLDTHPRLTITSKSAGVLMNYMQKLNLIDSWRGLHALDHDFSRFLFQNWIFLFLALM